MGLGRRAGHRWEGLEPRLSLRVPPGEDPEYQLRVKESVTVQEGLCVHVPCSFSYPWKPWYSRTMLYIYWFREKDTSSNHYPVATNNPQRAVKTEARGRFRLVGDPWAYNCSLRIRDAMRSDEGVYFFRVERGEDVRYTYTHTTMTLRVAGTAGAPGERSGMWTPPLRAGTGRRNISCCGSWGWDGWKR